MHEPRIPDAGMIRLIRAYLNNRIMSDGVVQERYHETQVELAALYANR